MYAIPDLFAQGRSPLQPPCSLAAITPPLSYQFVFLRRHSVGTRNAQAGHPTSIDAALVNHSQVHSELWQIKRRGSAFQQRDTTLFVPPIPKGLFPSRHLNEGSIPCCSTPTTIIASGMRQVVKRRHPESQSTPHDQSTNH